MVKATPDTSLEPAGVDACQFRYRGSRHESAVAQLFSLGIKVPCAIFATRLPSMPV